MKLYDYQAGWYYFINDHLGTPQKIIDSSGQVVWAGFYQPFGKAWAYPAAITNNFRFPGQYYDAETGLHYNWNRYYDPDTGRYLTPDPIGLEGGVNLYAYVMGNPINLGDLYGLDAGVITIPLVVIAFLKAAAFVGSAVIVADLINELIHMMSSESNEERCDGANEPSTDMPPDPDDKKPEPDKSKQRAKRLLQQRIEEHEAKLEAYKKDPYAFDNKGFLKNAPSDEIRKRIIEGRIRHLEHEIELFRQAINSLM